MRAKRGGAPPVALSALRSCEKASTDARGPVPAQRTHAPPGVAEQFCARKGDLLPGAPPGGLWSGSLVGFIGWVLVGAYGLVRADCVCSNNDCVGGVAVFVCVCVCATATRRGRFAEHITASLPPASKKPPNSRFLNISRIGLRCLTTSQTRKRTLRRGLRTKPTTRNRQGIVKTW